MKKSYYLLTVFIALATISKGQDITFGQVSTIQLSNATDDFSFITLYDADGDGSKDIVSIYDSVDIVSLPGGEVQHHKYLFQSDLESTGAYMEDLNSDGHPDLVVGSYWSNGFRVYLGHDQGGYAKPVLYNLDGHCSNLRIGDINGDQYPDIVALRNGSGKPIAVHVFLGAEDGTFTRSYFHDAGDHTDRELHITDLNKDGRNDILIRSSNGFIVTYLQHDPSSFSFHYIPVMPFFPGTPLTIPGGIDAATADLDNDQNQDLLMAYSDSLIVRQGDGTGDFFKQSYYKSRGHTLVNLVIRDIDKDDTLDIIGTGLSEMRADSVFIFKYNSQENQLIRTHAIKIPEKVFSASNNIYAEDLTGDKVMDLAVLCANNRLVILQGKKLRSGPIVDVDPPVTEQPGPFKFPNPSGAQFYLHTQTFKGQPLEVELYSLQGTRIKQWQFEHITTDRINLELKNVPPGIYTLWLSLGDMLYTERAVFR